MSFSYIINCENDNKPKTNADKYLKDGVNVEELIADLANYIRIHNTDTRSYLDILHAYFNKSIKPTLTENEKVILSNVQMQFTLISRDEHADAGKNDLYITDDYGEGWTDFSCFNHLFQFIQPRRRI